MRRVIDCVLPSGEVNRNSVPLGLVQVSCVRTGRWLEINSTHAPTTKLAKGSSARAAAWLAVGSSSAWLLSSSGGSSEPMLSPGSATASPCGNGIEMPGAGGASKAAWCNATSLAMKALALSAG